VEMTPLSRAEEGNLFYQAQVNAEDPCTFFIYEQYVDEAAYEAQLRGTYGIETVERDAAQLGHAIAATAERFKPAGLLIDLLFGEAGPLSILVALAPSIRAARTTLLEKAKTRRMRAEIARQEAEAAQVDGEASNFEEHDNWGERQEP